MVLRKWWQKALFVVLVGGLTFLLLLLVSMLLGPTPGQVPQLILYIVEVVLVTVEIYVGTRLFRGKDETDDPRPRWRASAGPRFGYVIAGLSAVAIIGYVVSPIDLGNVAHLVTIILLAVQSLAVGIFYLRSSLRLSRLKLEAKAAAEKEAKRTEQRAAQRTAARAGQRSQPRAKRR